MIFAVIAYYAKSLLFVKKETKAEGDEQTKKDLLIVEDRGRVDLAMADLKSTFLLAMSEVKGELKADQKTVMHRLGELESTIKEIRSADVDRTSKIIAIDGLSSRVASMEAVLTSMTGRLVKVETKIEDKE